MKCRLGRRLARLRWSAAAAPPGKYHTHTPSLTHSHTHSHTQLYNRTALSPVCREFKQLFDKIRSTCLSYPPPTHTHFFASFFYIHTALKINRARRFPQYVLPSRSSSPHSDCTHMHKATQESSCLQQETHSTQEKDRKCLYVMCREQILLVSSHLSTLSLTKTRSFVHQ